MSESIDLLENGLRTFNVHVKSETGELKVMPIVVDVYAAFEKINKIQDEHKDGVGAELLPVAEMMKTEFGFPPSTTRAHAHGFINNIVKLTGEIGSFFGAIVSSRGSTDSPPSA